MGWGCWNTRLSSLWGTSGGTERRSDRFRLVGTGAYATALCGLVPLGAHYQVTSRQSPLLGVGIVGTCRYWVLRSGTPCGCVFAGWMLSVVPVLSLRWWGGAPVLCSSWVVTPSGQAALLPTSICWMCPFPHGSYIGLGSGTRSSGSFLRGGRRWSGSDSRVQRDSPSQLVCGWVLRLHHLRVGISGAHVIKSPMLSVAIRGGQQLRRPDQQVEDHGSRPGVLESYLVTIFAWIRRCDLGRSNWFLAGGGWWAVGS